nr:MAG TPA: hypothetical protein [Caudoviricetes sp.]
MRNTGRNDDLSGASRHLSLKGEARGGAFLAPLSGELARRMP